MVGSRTTEEIFLKGKIKWCKHLIPDPTFNKWSVTLYPDSESLDKIRDLQAEGMKNHVKKDDDGWFCTFSRPQSREYKGKITGLEPPRVINKEGIPIDGRVGNGSDGIVKLEVYQHKTPGGGHAKAARWVGLRVDNLVEFTPEGDYSEVEKAELKTLREEPEQLF